MRRHGECDISLQVNGFPASMGIHQNTPIGEKPYEYKEYGKSPVRPGLLCICSVTHTIGKCYECDQCGKDRSQQLNIRIIFSFIKHFYFFVTFVHNSDVLCSWLAYIWEINKNS